MKELLLKQTRSFGEKLVRLSLIEDNSNVIEQPEVLEPENPVTRNDARQKIIDSVSKAITESIERGEEYTLSNLIDLDIPDSQFSVSVNDNIAILNVDGYEFSLDSEFNLSE